MYNNEKILIIQKNTKEKYYDKNAFLPLYAVEKFLDLRIGQIICKFCSSLKYTIVESRRSL